MSMQSSLFADETLYLDSNDQVMGLIKKWRDVNALRPLDYTFAKGICEIAQDSQLCVQPFTLLFAAIGSLYLSDGHVCLDLDKVFKKPNRFLRLPKQTEQDVPRLGDILAQTSLKACVDALAKCDAIRVYEAKNALSKTPDVNSATPFSLKGVRFYLSRFFHYEETISQGVYSRLSMLPELSDPSSHASDVLSQSLAVLFESDDRVKSASQIRACALAARSQFSVITGGPGTGKTTTVVKLLAALQAIAGSQSDSSNSKLRIALATPTGKASARLSESIGKSVGKLPLNLLPGQVTAADIPISVKTIHQLLGSRRNSRLFNHHAQNPLPVDVLVIDEASMVDVSLMASVILALNHKARLILLGDKDQLASVDAGAVLGQLAANAHENNYTLQTCDWLSAVLSKSFPTDTVTHLQAVADGSDLAQNIAMLDHSFRFENDSGIGQLAKMVNSGRVDNALLAKLEQTQLIDALWLLDPSKLAQHVSDGSVDLFQNAGCGRMLGNQPVMPPKGYQDYLSLLYDGEKPTTQNREASDVQWDNFAKDVLSSFDHFQVLCAMRKGPYGVEQINNVIEQALIPASVLEAKDSFYHGRPVLVTRNDYNLGLTNGDVGVVINKWIKQVDGEYSLEPRVVFPNNAAIQSPVSANTKNTASANANVRWFSPSRLQSLETVFAMTVHKSQGSEFEHACVVLPDTLNPVVTKELVYTAITRAKSWISIVSASQSVLQDAIRHPISRESGLSMKQGSD